MVVGTLLPSLRLPSTIVSGGGGGVGSGFSTRISSRQGQSQQSQPSPSLWQPAAGPASGRTAKSRSTSVTKKTRAVPSSSGRSSVVAERPRIVFDETHAEVNSIAENDDELGMFPAHLLDGQLHLAISSAPTPSTADNSSGTAAAATSTSTATSSSSAGAVMAPSSSSGGSSGGSSGVSSQQAVQMALDGLPAELHSLLDPSAPVALPAPGSLLDSSSSSSSSVPLLDNCRLDRLVAALGRGRATWRRVLMLYEWLKASSHPLDDRLCTTLIRVCADHGDAVSALSVYEWMCAPREAGGAALRPTAYTYTAAMRAALSVGMLKRAMQVWSDSQAAGLVPDCRLCITYIETCARLGLTDKAIQMYCQMRDAPPSSPMRPTVHAYTAAMRATTEGGRWMRALGIWEDMRRSGCQPTGHAYAAAITACAAGQDWARAVALFDDMTSRAGIRADVVSCTALVTALASAGEADKAEAVVQWMQAAGLKPNVRTYTALLTAMGNACQWGRAVRLLYTMQQPENGAVQPNAYTYSALLKALGEHGQWQLAEAVFSELERLVHNTKAIMGHNSITTAAAAATVSTTNPGGLLTAAAASQHMDEVQRAASYKRLAAAAAAAEAAEQLAVSSQQGLNLNLGLNLGSSLGSLSAAVGGGLQSELGLLEASSSLQRSQVAIPSQQGQAGLSGLSAVAPTAPSGFSSSNSLQSLSTASAAASSISSTAESADTSAGWGRNWSSPSQLNGIQLDLRAAALASQQPPTAAAPHLDWQLQQQQLQQQQGLASNSATAASGAPNSLGPINSLLPPAPTASLSGVSSAQLYSPPPALNPSHQHHQHATLNSHSHGAMSLSGYGHNIHEEESSAGFSLFSTQPSTTATTSSTHSGLHQHPAAAAATTTTSQTASNRHTHRAAAAATATTAATTFATTSSSHAQQHPAVSSHAQQTPLINDVVCGALMMSYERAGKWYEAVSVLARARSLGIEPNMVMYNTAVSAAGKAGQLGMAEQLFAAAPAADATTHETLLAAYGMAGRPDKAENLFRLMLSRGFKPRDYAYCGLIAAHSLGGSADAALAVRRRMARDGVQPSVHVYNALLAACERAHRFEAALELLQAMKREGVEPNAVTQQLMAVVGRQGVQTVESQQVAAAALSAVFAAAGGLLIRAGMF